MGEPLKLKPGEYLGQHGLTFGAFWEIECGIPIPLCRSCRTPLRKRDEDREHLSDAYCEKCCSYVPLCDDRYLHTTVPLCEDRYRQIGMEEAILLAVKAMKI